MRIMGLDYGTKRIGIAISDGLLITAQGHDSLQRKDLERDLNEIKRIIDEYGVAEIVIGLPLNMNGTPSAKSEEVAGFMDSLSKVTGLPIRTWDERLTSVQADRALLEADMSRRKRRGLSDKVAAQLILQNYLDFRKKST